MVGKKPAYSCQLRTLFAKDAESCTYSSAYGIQYAAPELYSLWESESLRCIKEPHVCVEEERVLLPITHAEMNHMTLGQASNPDVILWKPLMHEENLGRVDLTSVLLIPNFDNPKHFLTYWLDQMHILCSHLTPTNWTYTICQAHIWKEHWST